MKINKINRLIYLPILVFASLFTLLTTQGYAECVPDFFNPVCDTLITVEKWWEDDGISIDHQYINVTIDDQIATTELDMQFRNSNEWWVESTYEFPLPEGATVTNIVLYINEFETSGEVFETEEAEALYQELIRQNLDPALLQQTDNDPGEEVNLFELNVFPIEDNDFRRIRIEYQEILPINQGNINYVFPQNLAYSNKPITDQQINVTIYSDNEISVADSSSHETVFNILQEGNGYKAVANYMEADAIPDTNFTAQYDLGTNTESIDINLQSYMTTPEKDGYFTLFVNPLEAYAIDDVVPQDIILVIDASASMYEELEQTKSAVTDIIQSLNPNDRFNIVALSTETRTYSSELVSANTPGDYNNFLDNLEAFGETDIEEGLLTAFAQADSDRLTNVLLISDGQATDGTIDRAEILDTLDELDNEQLRLYSFGIGDADYSFLEDLTDNLSGSTTQIASEADITTAVADFYDTIRHPVLTNIQIDFGDAPFEQLQPDAPYDLFAGEQLIITGRYRPSVHDPITTTLYAETEGSVAGTIVGELVTTLGESFPITITGSFNGQDRVLVYEDQTVAESNGEGNPYVPVEWAKQLVDTYEEQIAIKGETAELKQTITNIGLEYQIITEYTSFLVAEDELLGIPTNIALNEMETSTATITSILIIVIGLSGTTVIVSRKK